MLPERPYAHFHSWSIVSCTTGNAHTSRKTGKKIYLIQERHLVGERRQVPGHSAFGWSALNPVILEETYFRVFQNTLLITGFCHQMHLRLAGWRSVENTALFWAITNPTYAKADWESMKEEGEFLIWIWSSKLFTYRCFKTSQRAQEFHTIMLQNCWSNLVPTSTFYTQTPATKVVCPCSRDSIVDCHNPQQVNGSDLKDLLPPIAYH